MSAAEIQALNDAATAVGDSVPQYDFSIVATPAVLG